MQMVFKTGFTVYGIKILIAKKLTQFPSYLSLPTGDTHTHQHVDMPTGEMRRWGKMELCSLLLPTHIRSPSPPRGGKP